MKLWYKQPATRHFEALPIGNGRIGGMVYGGANEDRIDLTEATFYSGGVHPNPWMEGSPEAYRRAREALLERDYETGERECRRMLGDMTNYGTHLPMATLRIVSGNGEVSGYRRELDIDTALATTTFKLDGSQIIRTVFCSNPDQVMVIHQDGGRGNCFSGRNYIRAALEGAEEVDGDLVLNGSARETKHSDGHTGVDYHIRIRPVGNMLLIAAGTTFGGNDPVATTKEQLDKATAKSFEELKAAHIEDHQNLFRRVSIDLGEQSNIPTDERIKAVRDGATDPALVALMFQYGRYALIASSRANSPLPAHLQGVWNDNEACRIGWTCDMHLDINTQMNYWPAETTNLPDCLPPLFQWLEEGIVPSGRETAQHTYGLPGWVAHTVSNPWNFTAPGNDSYWGLHPTGGVWIATHLWEHFLFSRDLDFLRNRAYPMLKEAAEFFAEYLVEDPETGYLVSGPSSAPENNFAHEGESYTNSMGTVCDSILIRELFNACVEATRLLGSDAGFGAKLAAMEKRLPPLAVGAHGQLMEWLEELEEATPHHRHTTHLLSVFPFHQIDPEKTPELAGAVRATIHRRFNAPEPFEDVAWSRANMILYTARLRDAEDAGGHVQAALSNLTEDNLMTYCPPHAGAVNNVHEMDGNTGFTAGVAEMLLQSHGGVIHLLPALPATWKNGSVKGLRARGGFLVDFEWSDGQLGKAKIEAETGNTFCRVRYGNHMYELDSGNPLMLDGMLATMR